MVEGGELVFVRWGFIVLEHLYGCKHDHGMRDSKIAAQRGSPASQRFLDVVFFREQVIEELDNGTAARWSICEQATLYSQGRLHSNSAEQQLVFS